jgi:hypothetical protein
MVEDIQTEATIPTEEWWLLHVGTSDYPSEIPDMHTIHDPMISVS